MMTLKEVPIGSTVTIKKVCATGPLSAGLWTWA